MSEEDRPLVLVHGFWHGSWCWSEVAVPLARAGRTAVAVDLAGHGLRAARPRCFTRWPVDPALVATEVSPVADVGLDEAADLLLGQLRQLGRPATVVAHSMGGTVLTRVAQQAPDAVAHAVYLAAFMPASEAVAGPYVSSAENAGELIGPSLRADPAAVGAFRLDPGSDDPGYRQQLRDAFYGDVEVATAEAAMGLLTPDAPAGIVMATTRLTRDGWGSVPRTYICCTRDRAIRPDLQRRFISEADAAFPDNPTSVQVLDSAHSPFLSMPGRLADALLHLDR